MSTQIDSRQEYTDWAKNIFNYPLTSNVQNLKLTSCYPEGSVWFERCLSALLDVEKQYVESLLREIRDKNIPGAIAEFGIYQGHWINHLYEVTEQLKLNREIWGFDSFKGLSKPNQEFDSSFWQEGMYASSLAEVRTRVAAAQRSRIKLVEGFFSDSLHGAHAQSLGSVSYARIDCDLYEPACECLRYLSNRLSNGAILVFDDWTHAIDHGEGRAFAEWIPTVSHLKFEFLFFGPWDHFYVRVWHR